MACEQGDTDRVFLEGWKGKKEKKKRRRKKRKISCSQKNAYFGISQKLKQIEAIYL